MVQAPFLLSARSIVKSFGPTQVLRGFDLSIARGAGRRSDAARAATGRDRALVGFGFIGFEVCEWARR
jgi:hypothetical protein